MVDGEQLVRVTTIQPDNRAARIVRAAAGSVRKQPHLAVVNGDGKTATCQRSGEHPRHESSGGFVPDSSHKQLDGVIEGRHRRLRSRRQQRVPFVCRRIRRKRRGCWRAGTISGSRRRVICHPGKRPWLQRAVGADTERRVLESHVRKRSRWCRNRRRTRPFNDHAVLGAAQLLPAAVDVENHPFVDHLGHDLDRWRDVKHRCAAEDALVHLQEAFRLGLRHVHRSASRWLSVVRRGFNVDQNVGDGDVDAARIHEHPPQRLTRHLEPHVPDEELRQGCGVVGLRCFHARCLEETLLQRKSDDALR
mmetsp:Transcript_32358/g.100108  ORF Transcript_32358/g.100108 Transcript_32358/m.100108 type:complete len:306 (-) Transcript_32358:221-1138(-)